MLRRVMLSLIPVPPFPWLRLWPLEKKRASCRLERPIPLLWWPHSISSGHEHNSGQTNPAAVYPSARLCRSVLSGSFHFDLGSFPLDLSERVADGTDVARCRRAEDQSARFVGPAKMTAVRVGCGPA